MATQPMRFFAAEFVREAAFELLHEELTPSVAVEIDEFREGSEPVYIRAVVYVERDSQKGIVIGEGGRTIKALGQAACAKCKGPLQYRTAPQEELICQACRLIYAVEDDIPIMLIDEAKHF